MNLRINWVLSNNPASSTQHDIKTLSPKSQLWGGWSSWHTFMTDNIICHDHASATKLVEKKFYLSNKVYFPATFKIDFGVLPKVVYYGGEFAHEIDNCEEIVAMHLCASLSDIVLLHGFDWRNLSTHTDEFDQYKKHCYKNLVAEVIKACPNVQWVLVDHKELPFEELNGLENLCCDTLENVKTLIIGG